MKGRKKKKMAETSIGNPGTMMSAETIIRKRQVNK